MAYESRIMIVNALREKNPKSENFGKVLYADGVQQWLARTFY